MTLIKLTLRNFQGIRHFDFEPKGNDSSVFGNNATGKTTLNSAFTWLLFGKDSQNKADFAIKTLDAEGAVIPGLDHEVEGVFELEGKTLTLRRVYHEVWTKQKGSANKEFRGHSTDYFIDGVPVKEKDYKDRITNIINEQTFRLLSDPCYFNEILSWNERREILIKSVGDISDEEVVATDKALATLPDILDSHKIDDYKKIITARKKAINEELGKLPVRIDEIQRGLPVAGQLTISNDLKDLKGRRNTKAQELAILTAGGGIADKVKQLREIEAELIQIQKKHWLKNAEEVQAAKVELRKRQDKADDLRAAARTSKRLMLENNSEIETLDKVIKSLREKWQGIYAQGFNTEDYCPTCGQLLPKT